MLAAPFILVAARFDRGRVSRVAGDTIVAAILTTATRSPSGSRSAAGAATLIPFVPQLPIEYLAAATAATTWLNARRHSARSAPSIAVTAAAATLGLTAAAAAIEVLLTPHAR